MALELACNNNSSKAVCYVKRELQPLVIEMLDKDKLSLTQLSMTLKNAAYKTRKDTTQDCNMPGNVLANLTRRIDFEKIPMWTNFLIKNYILNTLENIKSDWH
jgi:hypothetical protein